MVFNFKNLDDIKKARISAFSDASYVNPEGGSSQGGYIIFLHGENNHVAPILWRSRKINRVVRRTLAAETLALTEAAAQGFYIRAILTELLGLHDKKCLPITAITDDQSLLNSIKSRKTVDDKQLLIDRSCIKEKLVNLELHNVLWVDTKRQLADCLTKIGAPSSNLIIEVLQNGYLDTC